MRLLKPNGERIAKLRSEKGLTQEKHEGKISPKTLRKIERGDPARLQSLEILAGELGVNLEHIVVASDRGSIKSLDLFRLNWREAHDSDLIITDKVTSSASKLVVKLEPIDEPTFVDGVRAAEILKWHVDLANPSTEKLEYLDEVADLVDHFRTFVKGVGGTVGLITGVQASLRDKEQDFSFRQAISKQRKIIQLRELIGRSNEYGPKFLWTRYTFWGQAKHIIDGTIVSVEQNVRLILATDSEREKISAIVYVGFSPYEDDNGPKIESLEG